MEDCAVDPLAYAADADPVTLEEIARLDGLRDSIKAGNSSYLAQHPEIVNLVDGFIVAVLRDKPSDVFAFARQHFASDSPSVDVVVIAGPSGAGKGTIIKRLLDAFPQQFGFSCSHTTRSRRPGEEDGVHYHFTTVDAMREAIARGEFIEHAEVHGNIYGTSVAAVSEVSRRGQVCLLDIDVQGVKSVKTSSLCPKYIFVSPPSMEVLEKRLRDRATETEDTISTRLSNAREEIEYGYAEDNFDLVVENDDIDQAVDKVVKSLIHWYPKIQVQQGDSTHGGG